MNEYILLDAIGQADDVFLRPLLEETWGPAPKKRPLRRVVRTAALAAALALCLFMTAFAASPEFRAEVVRWITGDPQGSYSPFDIVPAAGEPVVIDGDYTPVFIQGTFASAVQVETRDGTLFAPLPPVAAALGAQVEPRGEAVTVTLGARQLSFAPEDPVALRNGQETALPGVPYLADGQLYVPLRFLAEGLGANMVETPALGEPEAFWRDSRMPISPVETIVRDFDNILIDLPREDGGLTAQEATHRARQVCLEALDTFRQALPEQLAEAANQVAGDIDEMLYLGEVSCYHKLTIGAYDILVDRYTQKVFFVIPQMATTITEVDGRDPDTYLPIYVVG